MNNFIPVSAPLITEDDISKVTSALREGWVSGEGPYVKEFEDKMGLLTERDFGISVANGSVALDLLFTALDLSPGDEVILPSFTIISCLGQLLRLGVIPKFVDAKPDTWNMNVEHVEELISPRTKAILAVHIYGLTVDMEPLELLAKKYGIYLLEDAAEAHGQTYKGKPCGSFGLASTFSFFANKNITSGEGGMVLTNEGLLASKISSLKNLSFQKEARFQHEELGWNYRLSSLQAALGSSQLERLNEVVETRKTIASKYRERLSDIAEITLPAKQSTGSENHYWVFGIVLDTNSGISAKELQGLLERQQIGTRPFFYPLHSQPVLEKYELQQQPQLPVSEWLGTQGLYLPNGLGITDSDIDYVSEEVIKAIRGKK